jgi:hypothetical protein
MKLFRYIFWITLGVVVVIAIANLTGLTTKGIDFRTFEEHEKFISNGLFWRTVTTYTFTISLLNLFFGGTLFLIRGIRNQVSRRKDVLVGILLIIFPIAVWFIDLVLTSMQSV